MKPYPLSLAALALRCSFRTANAFSIAPSFRGMDIKRMYHSQSVCRMAEYGSGMDQKAMMESDMLIVVDENDVVIPDVVVSKRKAHEFNDDAPRGVLHRAFSFFIFNKKNELLLTRRADSKITFPGVWTNTACSHPLHGMTPNEVDEVPAAYPEFPNIKHAASRKLLHELGISPKDIPHEKVVFVARFQYWASDTVTYGLEPPWGEHEVDYVLFLQVDEEPKLQINPDEVAEYKYVSIEQMKTMMEDPALKWSPWFCGIMEKGGFAWWEDLENTLQGKHTTDKVVFFDPPKEHFANYNQPSHTRQTGVYSSVNVSK